MQLHETAKAFYEAFTTKIGVAKEMNHLVTSVSSPEMILRNPVGRATKRTSIKTRPVISDSGSGAFSVALMLQQRIVADEGVTKSRDQFITATLHLNEARELAAYLLKAADEAETIFS